MAPDGEGECMPGAGTDKTKRWLETPAPVVVLVEPQLGENIGAAARAMANFGLSRLRLVKPLQGWPNERARVMAAGADRILDGAALYESLNAAIGDCSFVLATTARNHDQAKPVISAGAAAAEMATRVAGGETVAIIFGRERIGLENHEVALADRIVTLPVNPAFASLNLAQAVVVVAYEWFKRAGGGDLPFSMPGKSPPAPKQQLDAFFSELESELERVEFFRPEEKRGTMSVNLRNIFQRMAPTQQDIRTLHGVLNAIAQDRKSTRLNSSHPSISYAVFCLKKKNKNNQTTSFNRVTLYHSIPKSFCNTSHLLMSLVLPSSACPTP